MLNLLSTHWTGELSPTAFTLGRPVAWYGIIITCAMLLALGLAIVFTKRVKLKPDDLLEVFLIAIPLAIIGARLGYVFARFHTYFAVENFGWSDFVNIFAVWDGGLTIMWGAPAGILGGLIWAKWRKIDFLTMTDTMVFVIILAQAIGRWGNFFNQELYGELVTNPSLQYFPHSVFIAREGAWFQAVFFYESMANLSAFFILWFLSRHLHVRGSGVVMYAGFYALNRFIMEFFRHDGTPELSFNLSQIICGIVFILSIIVIVCMILKKRKKGEMIWYGKGGIPPSVYLPARYQDRFSDKVKFEK